MKVYKVLWFDDEHASLEIIKEQASINGIELIGFGNAFDGIDELERNYFFYDAVIIDGLFFNKPGQSGDAKSDKALGEVFRKIDSLRDKKVIPAFIFSGQKSFTEEQNSLANLYAENKVYDKQSEKDISELWNEIKSSADQQAGTQIRHQYQKVFDACNEKYIGVKAAKDLLKILKKENSEKAFEDPELYFNPLRKIMEDLFLAFNRFGFIPDVFIKPTVALNETSKFLSGGAEKGYKLDSPFFPKVVSDNVRSILAVCQPAAHRAEIDGFVAEVNSPYLLLSITYQLLDVLLWFKNHIDRNPDIEKNKANYKLVNNIHETTILTGIVQQDSSRNFHCGDVILTYKHVTTNGYIVGDNIRIIKLANNTNEKTMHLYSNSAITTEKI